MMDILTAYALTGSIDPRAASGADMAGITNLRKHIAGLPIPSAGNRSRYGNVLPDLALLGIPEAFLLEGSPDLATAIRLARTSGAPRDVVRNVSQERRDLTGQAILEATDRFVSNNKITGGTVPSLVERVRSVLEGKLEPTTAQMELFRRSGGKGSLANQALTDQLAFELRRSKGPESALILDPRLKSRRFSGAAADIMAVLASNEVLNRLGDRPNQPASVQGLSVADAGLSPKQLAIVLRGLKNHPEFSDARRALRDAIGEEGRRLQDEIANDNLDSSVRRQLATKLGAYSRNPFIQSDTAALRPYFNREMALNLGGTVGSVMNDLYNDPGAPGADAAVAKSNVLTFLERSGKGDVGGGLLGSNKIFPTEFRDVILAHAGISRGLNRPMTPQEFNRLRPKEQVGIGFEAIRQMERYGAAITKSMNPESGPVYLNTVGGRLHPKNISNIIPSAVKRREVSPSVMGPLPANETYSNPSYSSGTSQSRGLERMRRLINSMMVTAQMPSERRFDRTELGEFVPRSEDQKAQEDALASKSQQEQARIGANVRKKREVLDPDSLATNRFLEGFEDRIRGGKSSEKGRLLDFNRRARSLTLEGFEAVLEDVPQLYKHHGKKLSDRNRRTLGEVQSELAAIRSKGTVQLRELLTISKRIESMLGKMTPGVRRQLSPVVAELESVANASYEGRDERVQTFARDDSEDRNRYEREQRNKRATKASGELKVYIDPNIRDDRGGRNLELIERNQYLPDDSKIRAEAYRTLGRLGFKRGASLGGSPGDTSHRGARRRELAGAIESESLIVGRPDKRRLSLFAAMMGRQPLEIPEGRSGKNPGIVLNSETAAHLLGIDRPNAEALTEGMTGIEPDRNSGQASRAAVSRDISSSLKRANAIIDVFEAIDSGGGLSGDKRAVQELESILDEAASGKSKDLRGVRSRFESWIERYMPGGLGIPNLDEFAKSRTVGSTKNSRGRVSPVESFARSGKRRLATLSNPSARSFVRTSNFGAENTTLSGAESTAQITDPYVERLIEEGADQSVVEKAARKVFPKVRRHKTYRPKGPVVTKFTQEEGISAKASQARSVAGEVSREAKINEVVKESRIKSVGGLPSIELTDSEFRYFSKLGRMEHLMRAASEYVGEDAKTSTPGSKTSRPVIRHKGRIVNAGTGEVSVNRQTGQMFVSGSTNENTSVLRQSDRVNDSRNVNEALVGVKGVNFREKITRAGEMEGVRRALEKQPAKQRARGGNKARRRMRQAFEKYLQEVIEPVAEKVRAEGVELSRGREGQLAVHKALSQAYVKLQRQRRRQGSKSGKGGLASTARGIKLRVR